MLTRAKIAYNLHISPHIVEVDYEGKKVTYHFSSELYTNKFLSRMKDNREIINESICNRFGININLDILADLKLYNTIEKRGYLISIDGEQIECQNIITLDGLKLTTRNSNE